MPNIPFITDIENVSADLSVAYLQDITLYSTPARNTLALYVYLAKRDADNNDTFLTISNSAPLTATSWQFALPSQDGNFVSNIFGFNIWGAGTYAQNACVYYSANGNFYIANTSTSQTPGGGQWTLITDVLATATNNSSVYQTQTYNWSSARAQTGQLGDAMATLGQLIIEGKCKSWENAGNVITAAAIVESAYVNFRRTDYSTAQKIIDWVDAQTALTI